MDLDKWDLVILLAAAFLAVTSLVRLMLVRRDELVKEIEAQFAAARAKRKKEKHRTE
jgi:hypothetical protein